MKRRDMMIGAAVLASTQALADSPKVFLDYDQKALDDAYTQITYAPNQPQLQARYAASSKALVSRIGAPEIVPYGSKEIERLLVYRARQPNAPLFVFVHGGAWHSQKAENYLFPAEMFLAHGISYAAVDFDGVEDTDGYLEPMVDQVCRAIAFAHANAAKLGTDPKRMFLGAHSSGSHLAGCALTTDWPNRYNAPMDMLRGAALISGLYDLRGPRLSVRSTYVKFSDETEEALSSQRHLNLLNTELALFHGTRETPEFQRQTRDFATAVQQKGKIAALTVGAELNHFEMMETLANPYGAVGRAALAMCLV
jgi:arylformamidase